MTTAVDHEIIIVGAGFSGIGAAIALRNAGFDDFLLVDDPHGGGGAGHLNTNTRVAGVFYFFPPPPPPAVPRGGPDAVRGLVVAVRPARPSSRSSTATAPARTTPAAAPRFRCPPARRWCVGNRTSS